jgi:hypothetical protein
LGISKSPAVFVLNAAGVKMYHTEGSMIDHSVLFEPYYSIYASLLESNLKWKLDQVLQNKKAGLEDFKAVLSETMKITSPFIDDYSVDTAAETEVYETVEVVEDEPETDFKDAPKFIRASSQFIHLAKQMVGAFKSPSSRYPTRS